MRLSQGIIRSLRELDNGIFLIYDCAFTTVIPLEEDDQEEDFFLNILSNIFFKVS